MIGEDEQKLVLGGGTKSYKIKAFTLVELLAVIVILAVIALIATPIVLKVIETSEIGAFKNSVIIASKSLNYYLLDNNLDKIPETGIEVTNLNIQSTLISGKFITENEEIISSYVTDGKYCAYGTMDNLLIEEGCSNLDTTPPEVDDTNFILISTSSTVRVVLNNKIAEDLESGIKKYTLNLYQGETFIESKTLTEIGEHTFTRLTKDTEYKVELTVTNFMNQNSTIFKTISTLDIDVPTYVVSPEGWAKSKTVSIEYPSGYTNEYSLDGGKTWNPYTEAVLFTSNGTIIARVNDGTNYVTGSSQKVSQIDNEIPTVSVSGISTEYVASDDVTLTLEDSGSGVSYWCVTTKNDSSNCSWNSIENSTSTTATYTATSNGTYYAFAKDYLGYVSESYEFKISKIGSISGTPTLTASWPSTSQIKVVVSGMTTAGDTVSYRYSINGTVKQDWTTTSNYTFTGLTSGTSYTIKVETKLTNIGITGNSKTATIYTSKTVSTTGSSYSSNSSCTSSTYTFAASGVYPSKQVTASSCSTTSTPTYTTCSTSYTTTSSSCNTTRSCTVSGSTGTVSYSSKSSSTSTSYSDWSEPSIVTRLKTCTPSGSSSTGTSYTTCTQTGQYYDYKASSTSTTSSCSSTQSCSPGCSSYTTCSANYSDWALDSTTYVDSCTSSGSSSSGTSYTTCSSVSCGTKTATSGVKSRLDTNNCAAGATADIPAVYAYKNSTTGCKGSLGNRSVTYTNKVECYVTWSGSTSSTKQIKKVYKRSIDNYTKTIYKSTSQYYTKRTYTRTATTTTTYTCNYSGNVQTGTTYKYTPTYSTTITPYQTQY